MPIFKIAPEFIILFILGCAGSSLVAASRAYSLVVVLRLLIAVASLVAEHRLCRVESFRTYGSGAYCGSACGIFPDQGLNPCPLLWQADFHPLYHKGSPHVSILLQILYPFRLLFNIEESSLSSTIGPCWLSILFLKYYLLIWLHRVLVVA